MATKKQVRKNGKPVKRFWSEKATAKTRETHTSIYPVYFTSTYSSDPDNFDKVWVLEGEKAPRTLSEAIETARVMVESTETPYDHARVYELRLMHRVGVEYDWKAYTEEQKALHTAEQQAANGITLISTTSQP